MAVDADLDLFAGNGLDLSAEIARDAVRREIRNERIQHAGQRVMRDVSEHIGKLTFGAVRKDMMRGHAEKLNGVGGVQPFFMHTLGKEIRAERSEQIGVGVKPDDRRKRVSRVFGQFLREIIMDEMSRHIAPSFCPYESLNRGYN